MQKQKVPLSRLWSVVCCQFRAPARAWFTPTPQRADRELRRARTARLMSGFTLLELSIGFGLILIITGFAVFPLMGYKKTEEFNTQEKIIVAMLRDAQQRSITRDGSYRWGVRFTNTTSGTDMFQLFYGDSPTGKVFGGSGSCVGSQNTVTIVATSTLKSSGNFTDPIPGCKKDIVFTAGSGRPHYNPGSGFENKIVIVPNGFAVPPKTISISDYGSITF